MCFQRPVTSQVLGIQVILHGDRLICRPDSANGAVGQSSALITRQFEGQERYDVISHLAVYQDVNAEFDLVTNCSFDRFVHDAILLFRR